MPKRWSGVGSTAALGGVVEEAPEVRGPELAGTHGGEGEAVGATARPWLPLQRVELRMRRIVVVEADLHGRAAALPEVATPAGEHLGADGVPEREARHEMRSVGASHSGAAAATAASRCSPSDY